jgi:F0F1-type ATP synthase assembly protein I
MPDPRSPLSQDRVRQAKAWAVALDPVYGLIGLGLIGFAIDKAAGTLPRWTLILAILGLVAGFYRFIKDALALNREGARRGGPSAGPGPGRDGGE